MSGFTKGPWFVSKPKGEHRAFVMSDMGKIATVAFNSGKMNVNANGNLISAAPDMYEALMDARSALRYIRESYGELYGVGFDRVESRSTAALAKADGKGE